MKLLPFMRKYLLLSLGCICVLCGTAQLPVSQEPMHHKVFENSYVRVLDVHVLPGDTTQFHKHETPSVFIVLHPVKTGSEVIKEEMTATALAKDASISFEGFYKTPRIHRVWNEDSSEFHVMDIELLHKQPGMIKDSLRGKEFNLLYDVQPVRVYRFELGGGKEIELKRKTPMLIVGLDDTANNSSSIKVNQKAFTKKGDYLFIDPNTPIRFENKRDKAYSFAVLELK